jgi:hypothetical protein
MQIADSKVTFYFFDDDSLQKIPKCCPCASTQLAVRLVNDSGT